MHKFSPSRAEILDSTARASLLDIEGILDSLELKPDSIIADIGSGTGFFAIPASKRVPKGQIYAIDIQDEMHMTLTDKIDDQKISNIKTILSKENHIPLEGSGVDLAYIGNTLHELKDLYTLKEVHRILKPGSRLIAVDWKKKETPMGPPVNHRLSREEAVEKIESAGFQVTQAGDQGLYNYIIKALKTKEV
jgi:ubiquinone/menaquinone biosynthesis C-methylase UbiE